MVYQGTISPDQNVSGAAKVLKPGLRFQKFIDIIVWEALKNNLIINLLKHLLDLLQVDYRVLFVYKVSLFSHS